YSHFLLIPFISTYLVWIDRGRMAGLASNKSSLAPFDGEKIPRHLPNSTASRKWVAIPLLAGFLALALYWMGNRSTWLPNDYLALMVSTFLCFVIAACLLFLSRNILRSITFPLAFLVFMVPFPHIVEHWIEVFFQHTSASAAHAILS